MKLLLDQNLSRRLVPQLQDIYPDTTHVIALGLDTASDLDIWAYAGANGFTIVSKDFDFRDLAQRLGIPPKVVHLDVGNCSTQEVLNILLRHADELLQFERGDDRVLVISRASS